MTSTVTADGATVHLTISQLGTIAEVLAKAAITADTDTATRIVDALYEIGYENTAATVARLTTDLHSMRA